jgi:CSLREA domain-containing protein
MITTNIQEEETKMTRRQSLRLCLILVFSFLAASLASCRPAPDCDAPEFLVTKVVDSNDGRCTADDCSLREAIQNANYCPGPDVIRLPAGIYTLTIAGTDDTSLRGDLDIVDDVTIIGAGTPEINANGIDRVFDITAAVDVSMEGLLIRDGTALEGGGIRNNGVLQLTDVGVFRNEATEDGGGIYNLGSLTADQGLITENITITGNGGGIYNEGDVLLTDTVVANNSNYGIYNEGTSLDLVDCTVAYNVGEGISSFKSSPPSVPVTLTNTEIIGNEGYGFYGINAELTITGGSISNNQNSGVFNHTNLTMSGTTVSGNHSPYEGGGLYLVNIISATIENSTISGNTASGNGGGIYYWGLGGTGGVLSLTNVTVSGNTAGGNGGGIIIDSNPPSMMDLDYVTLSGNGAGGSGQAIYNNGTVNLHSTIIESPSSDNCAGSASEVVSLGYNISSDSTCLSGGTDDLLSTDPLLEPLADNGGGTQTHALVPVSPAFDSADTANCPATDQRGISRPRGSDCDRGAFELIVLEVDEPDVVEPIATLTPIPIHINFNADDYRIAQGDCTILRWQVDNASDVFLEGEQVETLGAQQVCPSKTTTYEMKVPSDEEELEAKVTIEVITPPAAPTGLQAELTCGKEDVVTLSWTDQADNETGYRVYRDGKLIAKLPANATSYQDTLTSDYYHVYSVEAYNEAGSSARISVTQEDNCYR